NAVNSESAIPTAPVIGPGPCGTHVAGERPNGCLVSRDDSCSSLPWPLVHAPKASAQSAVAAFQLIRMVSTPRRCAPEGTDPPQLVDLVTVPYFDRFRERCRKMPNSRRP